MTVPPLIPFVHGEGSGDNDSAASHPIVSLLASSIITRYILQPGFVARAAWLSSFRGTASSASLDCRRRCPSPTAPSESNSSKKEQTAKPEKKNHKKS
jgi:hypothetical protein